MHNMDDMMMRRLGVKFRLHPLALEDAMVPVVDAMSLEQRPKAEKFKEHLFFIIPRVRLVYETRRKRQTVVKMTKAARSVFWFLCCIPRLLFGCVSRCCRSCHRICIPPASRDRRGRHRRHSRRSSRTRFDSVPYVVHLFSRTQYLLN